MRLIDADELYRKVMKIINGNTSDKAWAVAYAIAGAETVEAGHIKHGRWLDTRNISYSARCSECRGYASDITPYCPNCGAKMNVGCSGQDCRNIERK